LDKYHAICVTMEEIEEEVNKELFLTEKIEEYEEGPDEGEILVIRTASNDFITPEN